MKFKVSSEFFDVLGNVCFGVVAAYGLDNGKDMPAVSELLSGSINEAEAAFDGVNIKEAPAILPYREAFRSLDMNPNKFMCSIEALLGRIAKKKGFPSINPAVDLGNAVSVKHRIPLGAHDLDTMKGDIEIRPATAADSFIPFGGGDVEVPESGEMIYVSGNEVRTRRWTWRQSEIGKITGSTSSIFFPLDGFTGLNEQAVLAARDELAALLKQFWNCRVVTGFVDKSSPEFDLGQ
ncbi:hypothetical protein LJC48_05485 [Desulfovibrio sp. OttesenSCG-928-C06]|nr:hypothetical protein [Desulfovibrio sp. OttesenSCG-928-C06]